MIAIILLKAICFDGLHSCSQGHWHSEGQPITKRNVGPKFGRKCNSEDKDVVSRAKTIESKLMAIRITKFSISNSVLLLKCEIYNLGWHADYLA